MRYRDGARTPLYARVDWFWVVGAILSVGFVLMVLSAIQGVS